MLALLWISRETVMRKKLDLRFGQFFLLNIANKKNLVKLMYTVHSFAMKIASPFFFALDSSLRSDMSYTKLHDTSTIFPIGKFKDQKRA